jgi:hypothetical protein
MRRPLASACDHLQVEDVVAQHAEPRDAAADAADDQRAADRQVEVVGEPGRRQPPRQRGREHLAPGRPGVDHHPVVLDRMNGPQQPHVGHDAAVGLAAAEHRVPPALGREGAAVLGGPADRGGDVLLRRREQDALRCPVHEVPEVVGGGGSGPVVDADPTVQVGTWWPAGLRLDPGRAGWSPSPSITTSLPREPVAASRGGDAGVARKISAPTRCRSGNAPGSCPAR